MRKRGSRNGKDRGKETHDFLFPVCRLGGEHENGNIKAAEVFNLYQREVISYVLLSCRDGHTVLHESFNNDGERQRDQFVKRDPGDSTNRAKGKRR